MLEELKIEEAVKAMLQGMQGMGANYAAATARTKEGDFRAQVIITTDEGTGIALDLLHDAIDEAPEGTDPLSAMLAAPALLAACKAAGDTLEALGAERSPEGVKVLAMVDAAVAQATGGEAAKEGEGRDDRAYAAHLGDEILTELNGLRESLTGTSCLACGAVEVIRDALVEASELRSQAQRAEQAERERYEARAEVERLRDRLATIIDEACGTQPLMSFAVETIGRVAVERDEARADNERLRGALESLSAAEQHYRRMHDRHGGQSLDTGRAWDLLRKAGIEARAALAGEVEARERAEKASQP